MAASMIVGVGTAGSGLLGGLAGPVFERLPVPAAEVDGRGRVVRANPAFAALVGEVPDGRPATLGDWVPAEDLTLVEEALVLTLRHRRAPEPILVRFGQGDGRLRVTSFDGQAISDVDEIVAVTGFRPDLAHLSEIRLDLDPVLSSPRALAPMIDPNVHSCGSVEPHGASVLAQPEPGFYLVGMKSYGRAPSFLTLTGCEQARSVIAAIAGDQDAADRVELVLPETGVCGGSGSFDEATGGGCCATTPELITIGGFGQSAPTG